MEKKYKQESHTPCSNQHDHQETFTTEIHVFKMAEFDEVSNEEKLQIAQHFLLSSPPGQFHEILTDVKKLLPDDLLTEQLATGIAHSYNIKTCKVVTAPSGSKTVLCPASEIDATHYIDPTTGAPFGIDHLTLISTTSADDECTIPSSSPNVEHRRVQLQDAIKLYLTEAYPSEESGAAVCIQHGNKLVVTMTGERTNLRNFWSGRITSTWIIESSTTDGQIIDLSSLSLTESNKIDVSIVGDMKIHAHYFEDGNVQLQSHKQFPAKNVTILHPDTDFGTPIVSHIRNCETTLEQGLSDMYVNMNEETFKQMRRLMPVTRNKMEWNINAVKMVRQIRK